MTQRAMIYACFSSDNQSEASIDDQVRVCKQFVAREGWDLVQAYSDRAISGATVRRPDYQAQMATAWKDEALDTGSTESS